MSQIITPAPVGAQEQETQDWFEAQKYRQVIHHLELLRESIDDKARLDHVNRALHELREVFNDLVPDEQRMGLKRAARRGV
jgi:hypothetical protein